MATVNAIVVDNPKNFNNADKAILIEEIRLRPPIWDKNDKEHHNRILIAKMWLEIKAAIDRNNRVFTGFF